jgi:hypothetical protein
MILLIGRTNVQRVVIERTTHSFAHRWPDGDEPLLAGDGFQVLPAPKPDHVPCALRAEEARTQAFSAACANSGHSDLEFLSVLQNAMQDCTVCHAVMRPADAVMNAWIPEVARAAKRRNEAARHRNPGATRPGVDSIPHPAGH